MITTSNDLPECQPAARRPPLVWLCDRCSTPGDVALLGHEWLCRVCAQARIDADRDDAQHPIHRVPRSA